MESSDLDIYLFLFHSLLLQTPQPVPGAYNLMLQSRRTQRVSFSACLPEPVSWTQCSAQRGAGLRRKLLHSGPGAWKLVEKRTPGEGRSEAAASPLPPAAGHATLPRGYIPQRRLRLLSSINAICMGIGCNKSCKSLTAERTPQGQTRRSQASAS